MSTFSGYMFESSELQEPALPDVDVESIVKDEDVEAAYEENMIEAAARIVAESTINWNNILEACTITEFCYLEENHQEFVYEAGALSSFFEKAKKFFLNIWEKIKAIFKKAMMQFTSIFSSDKDFLNKYKKTIYAAKNLGFKEGKEDAEMALYPFPWLNKGADAISTVAVTDADKVSDVSGALKYYGITAPSETDGEAWKKENEKLDADKQDEKREEERGAILTWVKSESGSSYTCSTGKVDAGEFSTELKNILNGGDSKDDVKVANAIDDAMKYLENSAKIKSALNKLLKNTKKNVDNQIKQLEKFQKDLGKDVVDKDKQDDPKGIVNGAKHSILTKFISIMKFKSSLYTTADAAIIQSLKACSHQCKSVCVKAVSLAKTTKHEGTTITSESSMSLLDGIDLV